MLVTTKSTITDSANGLESSFNDCNVKAVLIRIVEFKKYSTIPLWDYRKILCEKLINSRKSTLHESPLAMAAMLKIGKACSQLFKNCFSKSGILRCKQRRNIFIVSVAGISQWSMIIYSNVCVIKLRPPQNFQNKRERMATIYWNEVKALRAAQLVLVQVLLHQMSEARFLVEHRVTVFTESKFRDLLEKWWSGHRPDYWSSEYANEMEYVVSNIWKGIKRVDFGSVFYKCMHLYISSRKGIRMSVSLCNNKKLLEPYIT